jgi:hypothetical protein
MVGAVYFRSIFGRYAYVKISVLNKHSTGKKTAPYQ